MERCARHTVWSAQLSAVPGRVMGRHGCRYIHLHTSNNEQICPTVLIERSLMISSTTLIIPLLLSHPLYFCHILLSHPLYYYHTPSTSVTSPLLLSHPLYYCHPPSAIPLLLSTTTIFAFFNMLSICFNEVYLCALCRLESALKR